jgi:hypothetical protein
MKRAIAALATSLLLACSPSAEDADTMSLGSIDTVKAATDSGAVAPTAGATTGAGATATSSAPATGVTQSKTTAATQSKTGTKTAPADTTNLGRDRAIPINTKDPRVRLPTVDTTKRPPGGA